MSDTIAAVATAYGIGSISIIRVSGKKAYEVALKLSKKEKLMPRYATYSKIYNDKNEFIDEAIIIYFKAPFSFTGEDVIEFQLHGGFSVSEIVMDELLKNGIRLAEAGEFSKIACLNGKMSVLKALNIQDLIMSKSTQAAKIIARNMSGSLGEFLEQIRIDLVKTLAFVETSIDYADDDLPQDLLDDIKSMCKKNANVLSNIANISQSKKGLINGFKIAILGKPNVGKSSLLNSLLYYDRAIVSNVAGTTRDTIEENLKIGTHLVKIIDTAGIRISDDEIEKIGINLSKKAIEEADIIIAVFDFSRKKDKDDEIIFELLKDCDKKIFWVLNKIDLKQEFHHDIKDFIKISAKNSSEELKNEISNFLNTFDTSELMISSMRLIQSCQKASLAIMRAKDLLQESSLELFAFELNIAIEEIAKFTKSFDKDEILDEMFSNFCLGK